MSRKKGPRVVEKVGKISSKNEFELCYLRHKYIKRIARNPTTKQMKPFMQIAAYWARTTYSTYRNLFFMVGLEHEDLVNIANVHLASFLGLFSLERMPDKYKDFVKTFKRIQGQKPDKSDFIDKNKANFVLFLKQRMEDVVRVCRQKVRSIKGFPAADEFKHFYGPTEPPRPLKELTKNHERFGYRKLDPAVYKSIRKKAKCAQSTLFKFGKNYYVAIPLEKKALGVEDFAGADMDPYDNLHNMTPESVYFTMENTEIWEKRQEEFDNKPANKRANIIKKFIRLNRNKPEFREELKAARKILKEI